MEQPQFIDIDAEAIKADIIAAYEQMTGRVLQPAQVEMLLINAFAYREYLLRTGINEAAKQNLVAFSRAPMLDYLGELVGVRRLTASASQAQMQFTLIAGHGALIIPAGMRIQSIDGQAVFATLEDKVVAASDATATVWAECVVSGAIGNGFDVGEISIILDPQPYLTSATNLGKTSGGADAETDDELRERIKLAPGSFSNAGSKGAYEFFAKSAHPAIVDVSITSPTPGQVNIYPLLNDGELPGADVLQAVDDACNSDKVRPLTDTVVVAAPGVQNYSIDVSLTLLNDAIESDVVNTVTANLNDYINSRKEAIGRDVVREQIIQRCMVDRVYSVEVNQPAATITVPDDKVAINTGLTVAIGGYSDE